MMRRREVLGAMLVTPVVGLQPPPVQAVSNGALTADALAVEMTVAIEPYACMTITQPMQWVIKIFCDPKTGLYACELFDSDGRLISRQVSYEPTITWEEV